MQRKPKLAVVSTFDDLCGIAGYTRALIRQLDDDFDIEVFDLDQFFMRSTNRRVRTLADGQIRAFCDRMREFDEVNIQLEYGTLGADPKDILRRLRALVKAAPRLSVTFHTILPQDSFPVKALLGDLATLKLVKFNNRLWSHLKSSRLTRTFYGLLRKEQAHKPVSIIVHTRRDARLMKYINRLDNVYDHPLAFIGAAEARDYRRNSGRHLFPLLAKLPADAKVIGVFGFLSEYKGFEVAIQALNRLPDHYHLALFGGVHPNSIAKGVPINPYVKTLIETSNAGATLMDTLGGNVTIGVTKAEDATSFLSSPTDSSRRVHYMGACSDEDFARGMTVCDAVVLPYLEVGQSSSGILALALDLDARIIASRNHAFMQFARYHPNTIEFFEIGNFADLADRIASDEEFPAATRVLRHNVETNRRTYLAAHLGPDAVAKLDAAQIDDRPIRMVADEAA